LIDLHAHILPGVDDGARTPTESLDIARAAVAAGIDAMAATPHVRDDYPTRVEAMEDGVERLREVLRREAIPLLLYTGGEVAIEWLDRLPVETLRRFGLGGNPDYLLVEFEHYGWPSGLLAAVIRLREHGITVVLAHPERSREVHAEPERLRPLIEAGALVQVTAPAVVGRGGRRAQEAALALIELELAHLLATDVHQASFGWLDREGATAALGDEELLTWLTCDVPGAIVAGAPLPARPHGGRYAPMSARNGRSA
jgi:protein-tyrosine phosphatase